MNNARRSFLKQSTLLAAGIVFKSRAGVANTESNELVKKIQSTQERIPAVGLGSWITFDVGDSIERRNNSAAVLQAFLERGGGMLDSSPMYRSAQEVIGYSLDKVNGDEKLFSATKVWTPGRETGVTQMEESRELWGVERFDLMQVHNLVDWQVHLDTLRQMKADGKLRYIGITTSHGRRHRELEHIIAKEEDIDFVQLTYNVSDRAVEKRLLPLAVDNGVAVIVNRPFQRGGLFRAVQGKRLPDWAAEIECKSWAQFFLKFVVSHDAVTCAIPATSQVVHLHENKDVATTVMPDAKMRKRMVEYFETV